MSATSGHRRAPGLAHDILLVARFELAEALRTRLLVVMVLLFVGGGALGAWGFTSLVEKMEAQSARLLKTETGTKPGHSIEVLRNAPVYRSLIRAAVDSDAKADYIVKLQPIVLFYGWASLLFLPWLVLFTSSDTISTEVASRAIRYPALRTSRLAYALGKTAGQAVIVLGVTLLCAATFFAVAWAKLANFAAAGTALGLLAFVPRVFIFTLPFLGVAMFASMATVGANMSRTVAFGGAVLLSIMSGFAGEASPLRSGGAAAHAFADLLGYLTPFGHSGGFIYPYDVAFTVDLAVTLALAVLYFAAGYAILRRRDL